jgi:hypothetical protein
LFRIYSNVIDDDKKSTNSFLGGAVSGGGFEHSIRNDNEFHGTCAEPSDADVAHVYVARIENERPTA